MTRPDGHERVLPLLPRAMPTRPARSGPPAPGVSLRAAADDLTRLRSAIVDGHRRRGDRQHRNGKLTARERLDVLLDPGTFVELDRYRRSERGDFDYTDGLVTGAGEVHGRRVMVYAQDFTLSGGSLGQESAAKIHKVMDLATSSGTPIIGLNDSGGARIQEGALALDGYGGIFFRNVGASGVVPQISVILGPCAGGAAYSPALCDFIFMVRDTSEMFLTGPDVIESVTGQQVSRAGLGGADVHASVTGLASFVHDEEEECLDEVRYLLSLLPSNNLEPPPSLGTCGAADDARPRLLEIVSSDPRLPYDITQVIAEIIDDDLLQVQQDWARNIVCGLARIDGETVGIVANQPLVLAGVLDARAAEKAARFVRFCDAFSIPLVTLVDVPGFLPGVDQEHDAVIRRGAKLLYAYCEATVPRIQVILRKAYGGAYIVMDSRSVGCDLSLAWPTNEIAVMGAEGAVSLVHRRELAAVDGLQAQALRQQLVARYRADLMHPRYAAERGLVDELIDPADTRAAVARGLAMLRNKRRSAPARKHGNIPL